MPLSGALQSAGRASVSEDDIGAPGAGMIRGARLSTEDVRRQDQLAAWQGFTAEINDVEAVGDPSDGFRGSMDMYDLGALQVVALDMDPLIYRHTNDHLRKSGIDHWWLTVVRQGRFVSQVEDRCLDATAGSVLLRSWVSPFSGELEKVSCTSFFMNRDDFGDISDQLDKASHRFVSGPMAPLLRDFLISVQSHLTALNPSDVAGVNEAFRTLLKAAILGNKDALEAAREPIDATRFEQARRFISNNLRSPALTADTLSDHLGMSRRYLYYLFERYGGVAKYIQNRRLAACYNRLRTTTDNGAIGAVAYEFGYTNLSSFYRQFSARYGFRPGEVRSAWLSGRRHDATEIRSFADWISLVARE